MKKILLIALLINCRMLATAQEQLSKKQLGDKLFERYEYFKAVNLYLPLAEKNNPDVRVIERIADCYRLMNDSKSAESWYATVLSYNNAGDINFYYYAEALLRNNKLKDAKTQFQAYYSRVNKPDELRFKLATCDSGAKWMAVKNRPYTLNAEKKLNSVYSDWGTSYYTDNSIVFTSDRVVGYDESGKQTDNRTGNGYFKLYVSNKDSLVQLPLSKESSKTFNGDFHAGPVAFNATTDTAWITITTTQARNVLPIDKREKDSMHQRLYTRRLTLLMATRKNGTWGDFKNFTYNNLKEYSLGQAALSGGGEVLYFTSDMPGGEGGTDIWYCLKQTDGSWSKPVNCGKTINTKEDEAFPVITPNGLSFASDGLPGMGGLDVFIAEGSQANWSAPVNAGYPLNSTADDFYYLTKDGITGYVSSNRDGGTGNDDIYSFTHHPIIIEPKPPVAVVAITPPPVFSPDAVHAIVYYDLDKFNIRADAASELDRLLTLLKANPKVKIKLSSYTDVRASESYNIGLSKRRAEAAMAYLLEHGIDIKRLSIAWFGKEYPVAACPEPAGCPEADHQLNRRTEITYDGLLQ